MTQTAIGNINWIGAWTLYKKEVWRFLKVFNQTVLAPIITTLLFLAIFSLALGGKDHMVEGIPFNKFVVPGLIMMAVVQNAFANTSSSLMLAKIQGVIIDVLMPPLSPAELTFSFALGGVTRGVLVGITVALAVALFVPIEVHHWGYLIFHIFAASLLLALLGVLTGVWAQSFDQMAAITNYIITPLAFLSGTFYSVKRLPEFWHKVSHMDPFFYMIDGFRYSMTGYSDGSLAIGVWVMLIANAALTILTYWVLAKGYRLKS